MRVTQDDGREVRQIKLFKLKAGKGRSNRYTSDATKTINGKTYVLELKSCDVAKGQISTSREFGEEKIKDWETNDGFLFSQFKKTKDGFEFVRHVFCTPEQLRPFFDKQIEKQKAGVADRAGLDEWVEVGELLVETVGREKAERLEKTFKRGTRLNDPRLSWKKVEKWGTLLSADDPHGHLKKILTQEK